MRYTLRINKRRFFYNENLVFLADLYGPVAEFQDRPSNFFRVSYKLKSVTFENVKSTKQPYLLQETFLDQLYIPLGSSSSEQVWETINKLINSHVLFVKDGNKFYEVISGPHASIIENGGLFKPQKTIDWAVDKAKKMIDNNEI